ncbi:MAG: SPOR domain-containing protein [Deltaproteobacteria bacterium]|nr:SPOR domain-containing protein [Deltaproteobacteria bacterium]
MAKKKKAKRKLKKQSLVKNILLFLISLSFLVGATLLFYNVIHLPGVPFDPGEYKKIISCFRQDRDNKEKLEDKTLKGSTNDFKYSFYDILYHQDHHPSLENSYYCIQIAAFKSHEKAKEFTSSLKEKRLNCTIRKRGSWYLVQWGIFPEKSVADRYRKKLSKILDVECIVAKM